MRKFFSYYKPYALAFAKVLLCALGAAAVSLAFPMMARHLTGLATAGGGDMLRSIAICGGAMLLLAILEALLNAYYDYRGHAIGAAMENDLRQELFSYMEALPPSFYDKKHVGELMSSLTNDLLGLAELYHHGPEDYLVCSVRFVGAMTFMCMINWRMALVACVFVPPMIYLTLLLNRRTRRAADEVQRDIAGINARAEEALSGIRVTQAFAREEHERSLFRRMGERFVRSRRAIYLNESVEYQSLTLLSRLALLAGTLAGAVMTYQGVAELGDLVAYIMYVSSITEPITHLAWMTTQFQTGLAGFRRAIEILETPYDIRDAPGARLLRDPRGEICFHDVSFRYAGSAEYALSHVTLRVQPGETVAVVGVSGAGKTTLCSLIARFYDPESGALTIGGEDIRLVTLNSLRSAISIVQQDTFLFSGSVEDNIRYAMPGASTEDIFRAAQRADADAFIQALPKGYQTEVGPRGARLSGGQRQRIAIARAFLRDAPILLLDEATSSLDLASERAIKRSLAELCAGRTTLIVAHRLETIIDADRIVVLSDSGIAEEGTHAQLIRSGGKYASLYRLQ